MICPTCNGKKRVGGIGCGPNGCKPFIMDCYTCDGAGVMPEEYETKRAAGEAMRQDRIARRLGLSAEAKRLGITPYELSRKERGLEPK